MVKKDNRHQLLDAVALVGGVGISTVATVGVGFFGGRALDMWLGSAPWATIIGIVLGMLTGFWVTYKRVTEVERDD
jgi:ATP synthase protein I